MCQEKFWLPCWLRLQEPWHTVWMLTHICFWPVPPAWVPGLRPELGIVILGSSGTGVGLLPYGQSWGLDTPVPFGHCVRVCKQYGILCLVP